MQTLLLASIYINRDKIKEIGDYISKIVNQYFSTIGGGLILGIVIVVIVFSVIRSPKNR